MIEVPPGPGPDRPGPAAAAAPDTARRIDSAVLLRDQRELIIAHGADTYRLRLTSKGKLILTK